MWEGALGQTNFRQGRLLRPYRIFHPLEAVDPTWHIFSNINLRAKFEPRGQGGATVNPETKRQQEIGPDELKLVEERRSEKNELRPPCGDSPLDKE